VTDVDVGSGALLARFIGTDDFQRFHWKIRKPQGRTISFDCLHHEPVRRTALAENFDDRSGVTNLWRTLGNSRIVMDYLLDAANSNYIILLHRDSRLPWFAFPPSTNVLASGACIVPAIWGRLTETSVFWLTFKMSHDHGWRGSCCSEHETW
jgi:hypothetical protein